MMVPVTINENRFKGKTVYGAVSDCFDEPVTMLGKSTNSIEMLKFVKLVRQNLPRNP